MQERALQIGAEFHLRSGPREGTEVIVIRKNHLKTV
jgi:hypothetical protein